SIIHELLWFLQGATNIHYLHENQVTIWDEWADKNGDLGPIYGCQWRAWRTADGRTIYQRSADIFLGVPFNIASYSLLTYMMAQQCDLEVGEFVWTGGDCHLYTNHLEQTRLQLTRQPYPLPQLIIGRKP